MPSRSQKIRLGVFIVISSFALLILLFIIGSKKFFEERDIYYISYRDVSVSGLEVGSPVKYLGISIGSIQNIDFDPQDVYNVIITISVTPGTPIKEDARANIEAIGITGLKMIEIRGGSNEAQTLKPYDYIKPGTSITENITGKAEEIANKVEKVMNNLLEFTAPEKLNKIITLAESATETFENLNNMVEENRNNLHEGLTYGKIVLARLDTITSDLQLASAQIEKLTASDTLSLIVSNFYNMSEKLNQADLVVLVERLREVVEKTNKILLTMDRDIELGSRDFLISLDKLKSTLDNLNETSRILREDPSVIIHGTDMDDIPDDDLD
jgi:phospholipid/cholesterol/gamma-HCH transport system substrate-binding protein